MNKSQKHNHEEEQPGTERTTSDDEDDEAGEERKRPKKKDKYTGLLAGGSRSTHPGAPDPFKPSDEDSSNRDTFNKQFDTPQSLVKSESQTAADVINSTQQLHPD